MKLIFTDFDGVLHPLTAGEGERFCKAGLLLEAIKGFENEVRVVITSSHRNVYDLDELKAMLPSSLRKCVVGITPRIKGQFPRYEEIRAYVKQNAPGTDWRALDDEPLIFPKSCPELILCNPFVGLDAPDVAAIRQWLGATG